jgi:hypothetical protein
VNVDKRSKVDDEALRRYEGAEARVREIGQAWLDAGGPYTVTRQGMRLVEEVLHRTDAD